MGQTEFFSLALKSLADCFEANGSLAKSQFAAELEGLANASEANRHPLAAELLKNLAALMRGDLPDTH